MGPPSKSTVTIGRARRAVACMMWTEGISLAGIERVLGEQKKLTRQGGLGPFHHAVRRAADVMGTVIEIAFQVHPTADLIGLADVLPFSSNWASSRVSSLWPGTWSPRSVGLSTLLWPEQDSLRPLTSSRPTPNCCSTASAVIASGCGRCWRRPPGEKPGRTACGIRLVLRLRPTECRQETGRGQGRSDVPSPCRITCSWDADAHPLERPMSLLPPGVQAPCPRVGGRYGGLGRASRDVSEPLAEPSGTWTIQTECRTANRSHFRGQGADQLKQPALELGTCCCRSLAFGDTGDTAEGVAGATQRFGIVDTETFAESFEARENLCRGRFLGGLAKVLRHFRTPGEHVLPPA